MTNHPDHEQRLDQATRMRLTKLGSLPVDTSRLEQRLRASAVPGKQSAKTAFRGWRGVIGAVAAVVAFAALILLPMLGDSSSAVASPVQLGRLHEDIVSGRLNLQAATSIEEANRLIHQQSQDAPDLPGLEGVRVQSCCLTDVQGRLVAVAVLNDVAPIVTLVVAEAPGFAHEMGTMIRIGERSFWGHQVDGIRMVMSNTDDRWLCVMGDRTYEELARIAAEARY